MFNLFIQGLKDGEHEIESEVPVEEIPEMFSEYFGIVKLKGKLKKIGNRYALFAEAECQAKMVCDITLEDFTETIKVEVNLSFKTELKPDKSESSKKKEEAVIKISPDGKYADIAEEIREIFAVSLPMKRIAPKYRGKEFSEIFPEYDANSVEGEVSNVDDRWAPLKKININ
jgi:uncharacterized metal-binding protein YceD (DUF177 family)